MRVLEAMDTCGSVRNVGKLPGALRDWKHEGNTTGLSGGKLCKVLNVVTGLYSKGI